MALTGTFLIIIIIMQQSGVYPYVCPVDQQQQHVDGLLLSAGTCSRYPSTTDKQHPRSAVNAGSVILSEKEGSAQTCIN